MDFKWLVMAMDGHPAELSTTRPAGRCVLESSQMSITFSHLPRPCAVGKYSAPMNNVWIVGDMCSLIEKMCANEKKRPDIVQSLKKFVPMENCCNIFQSLNMFEPLKMLQHVSENV